MVGLVVSGLRFACFWAGDSRAYMVREGRALQLTRDDSHVQDMIDAGELAPEAAAHHPLGHVVTAAVGAAETFELHIRHGSLAPGDRFLLCSDGLSGTVEADEAGRIVGEEDVERAARRLVDLALSRQVSDNVTALVVACEDAERTAIGGGAGAERAPGTTGDGPRGVTRRGGRP